MIDPNDYQFSWQVYLGVGLLAMLLWGALLWGLKSFFLRLWLILAAAAFLFMPVKHPDDVTLWVPASVGSVLSWITAGLDSAMPALVALGGGQVLALVIALLVAVVLSRRQPQAANSAPAQRREPELDSGKG